MVNNKVSDTQLAIDLIPGLLKENKNKVYFFNEIFNMLIEEKPDIFLDDIGDPRYGILRGIVSRYKNGTLFLKNIMITNNKDGMLIFHYSDNDLLKKEITYKLYVSTMNYYDTVHSNPLNFDDFINLDKNNQDFIKLISKFNKSIEHFLTIHNKE